MKLNLEREYLDSKPSVAFCIDESTEKLLLLSYLIGNFKNSAPQITPEQFKEIVLAKNDKDIPSVIPYCAVTPPKENA